MMVTFTLREMQPSDGKALADLMENDPEKPGMSLITRFLVDPYQAWTALKPDLVGVVAEAPGVDGLIGCATVAFDTVQFDGRVLPAAFLENLKVHHAYRGQGLGTQLAQWRVAQGRGRFGEDGVILTGTGKDNTASLATMKKWCKQFVGPLTIAPQRPPEQSPEPANGITVRAVGEADLEEIADKSNHFYADFNVYTPLSPEKLMVLFQQTPSSYHYRIAVDPNGNILAGMLLSERAALMYDEFRNVPPPMRQNPAFPQDGRLRLMEVAFLWFDDLAAAQYLWEAIRWEFRDRVNTFSAGLDLRSPLNDVFTVQPGQMQLEITLAINGPTMMNPERHFTHIIRG
jgi:GNAT superfamily N-acetyltransferase